MLTIVHLGFLRFFDLQVLPQSYFLLGIFVFLMVGFVLWRNLITLSSKLDYLSKLWYSVIGLLIFTLLILVGVYVRDTAYLDAGKLMADSTDLAVKALLIIVCILVMAVSRDYILSNIIYGPSYVIIWMFRIWALLTLCDRTNLLDVFLLLELCGFCNYLSGANYKYGLRENRASLNRVIFNMGGSLIMVYGLSILYGFVGALDYKSLSVFFITFDILNSPILCLGIICVLIGILSRLVFASFSLFNLKDEQSSAYLSVLFDFAAVRLVVFYVLVKLLWGPFQYCTQAWFAFMITVAIGVTFAGYISGFLHNRLLSVFPKCAIAQVGSLLLLVCCSSSGYISQYTFIMGFATLCISWIAIFAVLMWCEIYYKPVLFLKDLRGFFKVKPFYAFVLSVFFLNLAGLPPLSYFFVRINVVQLMFNAHHMVLSIIVIALGLLGTLLWLKISTYIYRSNPQDEQLLTFLKSSPNLWKLNTSLLFCMCIMASLPFIIEVISNFFTTL